MKKGIFLIKKFTLETINVSRLLQLHFIMSCHAKLQSRILNIRKIFNSFATMHCHSSLQPLPVTCHVTCLVFGTLYHFSMWFAMGVL